MYWQLHKKSSLTIENKILIYKSIIKLVWTYGIQIYNKDIIERFQSKTLRQMVDAPWYVTNEIIRTDPKVPTVIDEIKRFTLVYKERLENHSYKLANNLLQETNSTSRLKKYRSL